jgi:hypothetical protein
VKQVSREDFAFALQQLHGDVNHFHLLHYRKVDGFLVTAKNSGTHWLRHMLSHALAAHFDLPPPEKSSGEASDDFIGHPRRPPRWPGTPRIGSSHNIPSRLLASPALRRIAPQPPTVVLVRDLKEALLSFYVKWKDDYGVTLAEFVHGDPSGKRFRGDVWWYVQFFNVWGEIARRFPEQTLVVRYEDLQADPAGVIARIGRHYGIGFGETALEKAVAVSGRDAVKSKLDAEGQRVVSDTSRRAAIRYTAEDHAVLDAILDRRLKYDFGYGYGQAARSSSSAVGAAA